MGCTSIFCCFKKFSPNIITFIAIITNIIVFAFIIWGLFDLQWKRNAAKVLYVISFIILIFILIFLIIIYFVLNSKKEKNSMRYNKIGKIFCLLIIIFCTLFLALLIISEIMEIENYAEFENLQPGRDFPIHEWVAAILPGILGIIGAIITLLCVNILYKIFNDNISTSIFIHQNSKGKNMNNINPNSIISINDITQNEAITGNNKAIIPPSPQNRSPDMKEYPSKIIKSDINLNMI